jgi:hypothetical protein
MAERDHVLTGWCILRTSGRYTLPLAASLRKAGFEAWTPSYVQQRRLPRAKARAERPMPLLPTFVFAKARHVPDLVLLADDPTKDHEGFSVFRYLGRIPLIADVELEALRTEENRAAPKQKQRVYREGEAVKLSQGSFAGLPGVVQDGGDRRYTFVAFGGTMRVKISTFLLRSDEAYRLQPATGTAARAA